MHLENNVPVSVRVFGNKLRHAIDKLAVHRRMRWGAFALVFTAFSYRMVSLDGYYAAMYLLGFYIIQNLIQYITPSELPTIQEEEEMGAAVYDIPESVTVNRSDDNSKPILRKLGEFKLWKKIFLAASICFLATFVEALDVPVFWPILLFYFLFVLVSVVARQYQHMRRYGYTLGDFFKKKGNQTGQ